MTQGSFRHVGVPVIAIPVVAAVGVLLALTVGIFGGAAIAGYVSTLRAPPPPVEIVHYVPRSPSAHVAGARPGAPVEPR
jgi:hypothetical protein